MATQSRCDAGDRRMSLLASDVKWWPAAALTVGPAAPSGGRWVCGGAAHRWSAAAAVCGAAPGGRPTATLTRRGHAGRLLGVGARRPRMVSAVRGAPADRMAAAVEFGAGDRHPLRRLVRAVPAGQVGGQPLVADGSGVLVDASTWSGWAVTCSSTHVLVSGGGGCSHIRITSSTLCDVRGQAACRCASDSGGVQVTVRPASVWSTTTVEPSAMSPPSRARPMRVSTSRCR